MKYNIILAASTHQVDAMYTNQIIPVRGKPAIARILEENSKTGSVILVLDRDNLQTINYVSKRYPNIQLALIDAATARKTTGFSILHSLACGMNYVHSNADGVRIILGDTLCPNIPDNFENAVIVSDEVSASERWCLVETNPDHTIKNIYDKVKNINLTDKFALVGVYQFADVELLREILLSSLEKRNRQISDLLKVYAKIHPIKCVQTSEWFDFGHKSGLIKAQNAYFNSRDFNHLFTDPVRGTITKISGKVQKLQDEYDWYNSLPEELKMFAPRTFGFHIENGNAHLTMEMYGYPALSELFVLGTLGLEEWELVLQRLFEVHKLFESHAGELSKQNFQDLYINKTTARIKDLLTQDQYWQKLSEYPTLKINDKEYQNIPDLLDKLYRKLEQIVNSVNVSVMHGDYCFSNILFDTNLFMCRLIDPRGRLNQETIYGDARYDIAKLRHSVVGGYDWAVHGLYNLVESGNTFVVTNNYPEYQTELTRIFDELVIKFGYDLQQIKLIEAVLFLSMIPLHKDDINRQKMFYLKAVIKLNECLLEKKGE